MIDAETFEAKVGRAPVMDDLERVNCEQVGEIGHWYCGWCERCDKPRFICGHAMMPGAA